MAPDIAGVVTGLQSQGDVFDSHRGLMLILGKKAKEVFEYMMSLPKTSNREKRVKRLKEFEKQMKKKQRP